MNGDYTLGAKFIEMQMILMSKFINKKGLMKEYEEFMKNEFKESLEAFKNNSKEVKKHDKQG